MPKREDRETEAIIRSLWKQPVADDPQQERYPTRYCCIVNATAYAPRLLETFSLIACPSSVSMTMSPRFGVRVGRVTGRGFASADAYRPHDDGLDIPEQVAERGPEIDERRLRGRVHDADSLRRPAHRLGVEARALRFSEIVESVLA